MLQVSETSEWPVVLLALTVHGTRYLYSDGPPVSISSDDGDMHFLPGLQPVNMSWSIDLFGTADSKSVAVQVQLNGDVDLTTLFANGRTLYKSRAKLYVYFGGTFEDAVPFASGYLRSPVYGDPSDPTTLSFSIDRDTTDKALIPDGKNYVREDSWDSLAGDVYDDHIGLCRQILIGSPGKDVLSVAGRIKAVPTTLGRIFSVASPNQSRVELAGHNVKANTVKLWSKSNASSGTADVVVEIDDLGYTVAYADLTTYSGTLSALLDDLPIYAGFSAETHPGIDDQGFQGIGDVVIWALSQCSFANDGVDWERVHAARQRLNRIGRIDTWISERVRPYEWLKNEVLAHFPVYISDAGDGVYVDVWPFDGTDAHSVLEIDTSLPGFERITPVSWDQPELANSISIAHQYSDAVGSCLRYVVMSGDPDATVGIEGAATSSSDSPLLRHPLLDASYQDFGLAELEVEIPTVSDRATIYRIAQFMAFKYALPRAEVGYSIPWRKGIPELGRRVVVNDAPVGLTDAAGVLTGVRMTNGRCEVRVSLLPTV